MPLEDSPKLESFDEGLTVEIPGPKNKPGMLRVVVFSLFVLVVVLTFFLLLKGQNNNPFVGSSSITGLVQSADGQGVVAEIFIDGDNRSTFSVSDGSFSLDGVADGDLVLIIGYQGRGVEIPITVPKNSTIDIGVIQVQATTMP
jgi:hypothetical protein